MYFLIGFFLSVLVVSAFAETRTPTEICKPVKTYSRSVACLNLIRDTVASALKDSGWERTKFPPKVFVTFYNTRDSELIRYAFFEDNFAGLTAVDSGEYRVSVFSRKPRWSTVEKTVAHELVHVFQFHNGHTPIESEAETVADYVYYKLFR